MASDLDLVRVLDEQREVARVAFQFEYASQAATPEGTPSVWDISTPVRAAMDAHPDFAQSWERSFLGRHLGFFNHHQAVNLLRVSLNSSGREALEWYRRVQATIRTPMRLVAEIYGLSITETIQLSNGIKLLPIRELRDSPISVYLKQPVFLRPGVNFPAAAMIELGEIEADESLESGHERFLQLAGIIRKTVTAFVLSDRAAPTMAANWLEFVDPEMEAGEFGRTWMTSQHDGRHADFPIQISADMLEWVEMYLNLPLDVANVCDVPLARLNLARRRVSPGDKAIDGSVCLEALLSGKARGELTHRLSVRTALLLGRSLSEREEIAKKVRRFYQLRSDVVHGSMGKEQQANAKVAEEGLSLCLSALQAVIRSREVPQPEIWELTGGPSGNRFSIS
jgi:Apea-like HEPN